MRVLIISGSFPPMRCGVGNYTASLARELSRQEDVTVAVLTSRRSSGESRSESYEILDVVERWSVFSICRVLGVVRDWRPDIVHLQYPTQGYDGYLQKLLPLCLRYVLKLPVVETLHEIYSSKWLFPALQLLPSKGFIVVRPRYEAQIRPWFRWLVSRHPFKLIANASTVPRAALTAEEIEAIRGSYVPEHKLLLVFFGFLYPTRGVELLFQIADPDRHQLLIVGDKPPQFQEYYDHLVALQGGKWSGCASMSGYLSDDEAAKVLACADAVVLPFIDGGGIWNTSIHSAVLQGTFVLTTAVERHGYDRTQNVYFTRPGDVQDMRSALDQYAGTKRSGVDGNPHSWADIVKEHLKFYESHLARRREPVKGEA